MGHVGRRERLQEHGGGGDGGGLTERGYKKKPSGDTVKSSLIQDTLSYR